LEWPPNLKELNLALAYVIYALEYFTVNISLNDSCNFEWSLYLANNWEKFCFWK